jgi:type VI secretion system protein VasD
MNMSGSKPALRKEISIVLMATALLTGCAAVSGVSTLASVANVALEATGMKKPEAPEVIDALKAPRTISIKLHAGDALNTDQDGRSLAVIARIYKLRQDATFQQLPYETFLHPEREKEALGNDVLEVKDVTLVPGQHYDIVEKVSREAYFIGVVTLFRNPAPARWRIAFAADKAEGSGIVIGLHACALSIGAGAPVGNSFNKSQYLSQVRCP